MKNENRGISITSGHNLPLSQSDRRTTRDITRSAMPERHDFSSDVILKLGDRVNLTCSNPGCRASTKGPHTDPAKAVNVGNACHIHGASPGGARYDAGQSRAERTSIDNGIWLCVVCAKMIDADEQRYPAKVLRAWKDLAEHETEMVLGKPREAASAVSLTPEQRVLAGLRKIWDDAGAGRTRVYIRFSDDTAYRMTPNNLPSTLLSIDEESNTVQFSIPGTNQPAHFAIDEIMTSHRVTGGWCVKLKRGRF